jgi:hypothetical protein
MTSVPKRNESVDGLRMIERKRSDETATGASLMLSSSLNTHNSH